MTDFLVIAVDGPVAAGKGTLALRLAQHYRCAYLDTGALYRRVAFLTLDGGGDPQNVDHALAAVGRLEARDIPDAELRNDRIAQAASKVAGLVPVREALLSFQRRYARPPRFLTDGSEARGAVLDGRDIGTVVCPDAPVKLFVTASAEIRARRRHAEFQAKGRTDLSYAQVLADLEARDERDRNREIAPLRPAPDAHLLDTSDLDKEEAFKAACSIIDAITG